MSSTDSVPPEEQASSKFVWPPVIYGAATVISGVLAWLAPLSIAPEVRGIATRLLGIAIVGGGVIMVFGAARLFRRVGTPVAPIRPSTALVTDGIYRWTRNPMYLGLSLVLLGIGVATGSLWFFIGLAIAIWAVTKLAIEREEAYLAQKFGALYLDYKSRVRRWI
jgi:protein-S-isoprenylcysteine O-methyltransferase Ste14